MKKTIKFGSLILLAVGLVLLYQYRHYIPWNYNAKPAADQPLLRIPFPAGTVVMCNQGNKSPAGRTHSSGNCLHALDFSLVPYDSDIVAAADGTVRLILDQVKPLQVNPGAGFGNQVRIEHENGYFTLYAHLDLVSVKVGDEVKAGQKIGTMGTTGNAGYPHLHFSLHQGNIGLDNPPLTVPIRAMVAADLSRDQVIREIPGDAFHSTHLAWQEDNHFYGSENSSGSTPRTGTAYAALTNQFAQSRKQFEAMLSLLDVGKIVNQVRELGARKVIDRLRQRAELIDGDDAPTWYYIGWNHMNELRELDQAVEAFEKVRQLDAAGKNTATWTMPWTLVRLGQIASQQGNVARARQCFEKVMDYPDKHGEGFHAKAQEGLAALGSGQNP